MSNKFLAFVDYYEMNNNRYLVDMPHEQFIMVVRDYLSRKTSNGQLRPSPREVYELVLKWEKKGYITKDTEVYVIA